MRKFQTIFPFKNLRTFTVFVITLTVVLSLLLTGSVFYARITGVMTDIFRKDIAKRLEQVNVTMNHQIENIESLYPLLVSNTMFYENLDSTTHSYQNKDVNMRRLEIERQMSNILVNTTLWNEKLINAVYVFNSTGDCAFFSLHENSGQARERVQSIYETIDPKVTELEIRKYETYEHSIYFSKNIYSIHTGNQIATIFIDINTEQWQLSYHAYADQNWNILLYNDEPLLHIGGKSEDGTLREMLIEEVERDSGFHETSFGGSSYFIISQKMSTAGLTSIVAANKDLLFENLNPILSTFLLLYVFIVVIALLMSILLSYAYTIPIKKMIAYVSEASHNYRVTRRPAGMFREFDEFANAFAKMHDQLQKYYNDLYHQKLLLQNAEIKALQAQIDPHFLFNILNTVAWKAQIKGCEDVYHMIISIGDLLRSNILSKDKHFIPLKEELDYARLYIYLQQERFEDKFTAEIFADPILETRMVPRFCIQPLVENAISHGLEPLTSPGRLMVRIMSEPDGIYVRVEDNGVGFPEGFSLENLRPDEHDHLHAHIGLNNLSKRLSLLYGPSAKLVIQRVDNLTFISFHIPNTKKEE